MCNEYIDHCAKFRSRSLPRIRSCVIFVFMFCSQLGESNVYNRVTLIIDLSWFILLIITVDWITTKIIIYKLVSNYLLCLHFVFQFLTTRWYIILHRWYIDSPYDIYTIRSTLALLDQSTVWLITLKFTSAKHLVILLRLDNEKFRVRNWKTYIPREWNILCNVWTWSEGWCGGGFKKGMMWTNWHWKGRVIFPRECRSAYQKNLRKRVNLLNKY